MNMIWRSIFAAAAILVAYVAISSHLPRRHFRVPGQQRANYFRAQRYLHHCGDTTDVIVGSSMANELNENLLGSGYFKLTFPGGSSFTGLELISHAGRRPRRLLIEANLLLREPDRELLQSTLNPWWRRLRDASPAFGEEGRPSNFGVGVAYAFLRKLSHGFSAKAPSEPAGVQERRLDSDVLAGVMRANRDALGRTRDQQCLAQRADLLGGYVDALIRDGCTCVFFEMPIDASLEHLAEPEATRAAMRDRFPPGKYQWLSFAHEGPYQTVDGIHLTRSEADELTRQIRAQLDGFDPSRMASVRTGEILR